MKNSLIARSYPDFIHASEEIVKSNFKQGQIISHEWIDEKLSISKNDIDYPWKKLNGVAKLKKHLLENYKIDIKNIKGKGYEIIPSEIQAKTAFEDTGVKIRKAYVEGLARCINVNQDKLTDKQKSESKIYLNAYAKMHNIVSTLLSPISLLTE